MKSLKVLWAIEKPDKKNQSLCLEGCNKNDDKEVVGFSKVLLGDGIDKMCDYDCDVAGFALNCKEFRKVFKIIDFDLPHLHLESPLVITSDKMEPQQLASYRQQLF